MSAQSKIEMTLPMELLRRLQLIARARSRDLHNLVLEALDEFATKHGPDPIAMEAHRASLARFADVYRKLADSDT